MTIHLLSKRNIAAGKVGTLSGPSDPYWSQVKFLGRMNTGWADEGPVGLTMAAQGNATISSVQYKFGNSGYFDGSGDYNNCTAGVSALSVGAGNDCCFECWVRPADLNHRGFVNTGSDDSGGTGISLQYNGTNGLAIHKAGAYLAYATPAQASAAGYAANVWTHIAGVRQSGTWKLYINGVQTGTTTANDTTFTAQKWTVGYDSSLAFMLGYIDDVRVTIGHCRYTGNFTPPTYEHPNH